MWSCASFRPILFMFGGVGATHQKKGYLNSLPSESTQNQGLLPLPYSTLRVYSLFPLDKINIKAFRLSVLRLFLFVNGMKE